LVKAAGAVVTELRRLSDDPGKVDHRDSELIDVRFAAHQIGRKLSNIGLELHLHFQDEFNLLVHLVRRHGVSFDPPSCHDRLSHEVIINPAKKETPRWPSTPGHNAVHYVSATKGE
jgi:hypothetical protein